RIADPLHRDLEILDVGLQAMTHRLFEDHRLEMIPDCDHLRDPLRPLTHIEKCPAERHERIALRDAHAAARPGTGGPASAVAQDPNGLVHRGPGVAGPLLQVRLGRHKLTGLQSAICDEALDPLRQSVALCPAVFEEPRSVHSGTVAVLDPRDPLTCVSPHSSITSNGYNHYA